MNYSSFILSACLLTISCSQPWTEKNRSDFAAGCLNRQIPEIGEKKAKSYCSCLLEKVVKKYPDARDASYIRYDTSVVSLAKECLKQP